MIVYLKDSPNFCEALIMRKKNGKIALNKKVVQILFKK